MNKLKKITIKAIPLMLIMFMLFAPLVAAAQQTLVEDGQGLREFEDDYVDDNFTSFDNLEEVSDLRVLYEDVSMSWDEGEAVVNPLGADIKSVKLDKGDSETEVEVEMYGELEDIDGQLMTLVYFNGEFFLQSLTNGTDIISVPADYDMNASISESSVEDETITITYDNDDYEYEAEDDWYVINVFVEGKFSESPEDFTFDIAPKMGGLNMFANLFGSWANMLTIAVFVLAIIGIWGFATYRAKYKAIK